MSAQSTNLKRVEGRIGKLVKDFCRAHKGEMFYGRELSAYVLQQDVMVAPGSADRILRLLRGKGEVSYEVVSRAGSCYRVTAVN